MSGWLHNLVAQSRAADRSVRPAVAYRNPVLSPQPAESAVDSEASPDIGTAPTASSAAMTPARGDLPTQPSPRATEASPPDGVRLPAPQREPLRSDDDRSLWPTARRQLQQISSGDHSMDRDDARNRRGGVRPAPEDGRRSRTTLVSAPPIHSADEPTVPRIRPSLPPRAAGPSHEGADAAQPAPVPDVHIHIGRIELTAVTAPAPRRESAAAPNKPMSLGDYLRRRDGGAP